VRRFAALIAVFALFVVGVGVGVLGTHLFYAKELHRHGGGGGVGAHRFITHLERELDLTEDQRRRIDEIVEQSRIEGDALHEEMLPRVREHMRQTRERVREVLTSEQQLKFDQLHERHHRRAEHFFLGHGRHSRRGPPPPRSQPPPPDD
jgi:Spy/CpxP family protein refolding chaperone